MAQTLAVIGTGYVGLVSGVCFAEHGNTVWCMDVDQDKIERLRRGESPIYEPGLEPLLQRNLHEGRLIFTEDLRQAIHHATVVFLCLPTPPDQDGSADIHYVLDTARAIAEIVAHDGIDRLRILVNRSTVPVGTTEQVQTLVRQVAPSADIRVASNPEFMSEGNAVQQTLNPDRVVVGSSDPDVITVLRELYQPFVDDYDRPLLVMDDKSAEVTKYAANAFLALRISFMNELSRYCESVGADIELVRTGISLDPRIGRTYLHPGIGFGGSCLPKDIRALVRSAHQVGMSLQLVEATANINAEQLHRFVERIRHRFGGSLARRRFAVWGLAFKPNTDDVRESPAHKLISALLADGATITAYDPEAMDTTRRVLGDRIEYARDMYSALDGADALIVATEWAEFRMPDWDNIKSRLQENVIFDGRNLWHPNMMQVLGFEYHSIGRRSVFPGV
ncbi:MAG: UDP-glucose/GDP-mannose dehydrogenase family protein [Chlorobi bacterium]|nr:UDP-glucose/GDP-mannose dehydrogenase family protein [Chlorobiota bacterium]